jgi:hypothetical protein
MSAVDDAIRSIEEQFAVTPYPISFFEKYDQMECLASHKGLETFLVREKNGSRLYVAKCFDRSVYSGLHGSGILQSLHYEGLPVFVDEFCNENIVCVVREYIEGMPLDQYVKEHPMTQEQIIRLCVSLCDILVYLHERTPPVIHRDIKPQNIIIRESGAPVLIDFDTARIFKSGATTDTQFFGTRAYAPPEQYGFTQTDCRADIYALGILLRFLWTGSTQESENSAVPAYVQRIIAKCTAFSPKERFSSARAVQKALLAITEHKRWRRAHLLTLMVTALLFLCAGFALGRHIRPRASPPAGVIFEEPLIERAARVQLDKEEGEPITEAELKEVRGLYLFGEHVYESMETLNEISFQHRGKRGSVHSLKDLALMPNLEEVVVVYQELEDISGISVLKHLVSVDFRHTHLSDLSPLANMQFLNSVNVYETNVSDAAILDTCPRLRFLELGSALVTTPMNIGGCRTLEQLSLKYARLNTLEGIERFSRLNSLDILGATAPDWQALLRVPSLKTISTDIALKTALSDLLAGSQIAIRVEE